MDEITPTASIDDGVNSNAWIKKCQATARELQLLSHYFKNQFNQKLTQINELNPSELLQLNSEWSSRQQHLLTQKPRFKEKIRILAQS